MERNHFVSALADRVFFTHASPDSKLEKFCHKVLRLSKILYTFESEANKYPINMIGAKPFEFARYGLVDEDINLNHA